MAIYRARASREWATVLARTFRLCGDTSRRTCTGSRRDDGKASDKIQREVAGIDNHLSGVVRVATSDTMASHFVIPAMQKLHASHPDIRIVLSTQCN
ncbi:LysR substrate-binding domain-containing protein [Undibacterium sp. Ji42W]|uniref:LysR substrate-binding domain-containing protein n=1 Tax=Undibacterium sp. Ji42W TaxID=3413039 RepID=UPI003BEFA946